MLYLCQTELDWVGKKRKLRLDQEWVGKGGKVRESSLTRGVQVGLRGGGNKSDGCSAGNDENVRVSAESASCGSKVSLLCGMTESPMLGGQADLVGQRVRRVF